MYTLEIIAIKILLLFSVFAANFLIFHYDNYFFAIFPFFRLLIIQSLCHSLSLIKVKFQK